MAAAFPAVRHGLPTALADDIVVRDPSPMPVSPGTSQALQARLSRTQRALALSLGCCMGLALLALFFALRRPTDVRAAFDDPELRAAAIERMLQLGDGYYDSHPDPEVARVLAADVAGREYYGGLVLSTNSLGLRERTFAMPKEPGTVRVVLLGDSFVFGSGLNADERFGAALERELRARSSFEGPIEVLHVGVASWNAVAECAWARRVLSELQPDLLIQLLVNNDLDDCMGVRGFGGLGTFTPQRRWAASGVLRRRYPRQDLGVPRQNWLSHGLDWESRSRFDEAARELHRLREAVVAQGGRYELMLAWGKLLPVAHERLAAGFAPDDLIFVGPAFGASAENRISPEDGHWSALGGEQIARTLYGLIVERDLLPGLGLESWPEAADVAREIHGTGERAATTPLDLETWLEAQPIASLIDFADADEDRIGQIHGGIDVNGYCAPYGSLILAIEPSAPLVVRGRALARGELTGARLTIYVDDLALEPVDLVPGSSFERTLRIEPAGRSFVSVRFVCDDWVNLGIDKRDCRSVKLDVVGFEER